MYSLTKNIEELLNKYMDEFHSENGVVVYLNTNGSVFMIGQFPDYCNSTVDVGVCMELDDLYALVDVLGIATLREFKRLSISAMEKLYKQGRAEMYCNIRHHGDFPLRFIKVDSVVIVLDDNDEVIEQFICKGTADDVISYTYSYFSSAQVCAAAI